MNAHHVLVQAAAIARIAIIFARPVTSTAAEHEGHEGSMKGHEGSNGKVKGNSMFLLLGVSIEAQFTPPLREYGCEERLIKGATVHASRRRTLPPH